MKLFYLFISILSLSFCIYTLLYLLLPIPSSIINNDKKTRLILVQSAGRSGSGFLSVLLSTANEIPICWHERPPITSERKWEFILNDLTLFFSDAKIYCESNYLSSLSNIENPEYLYRGFIENITQIIADNPEQYELDIIQLRRYAPLVLRSWMDFIGYDQFKTNKLYTPAYIYPMHNELEIFDPAIQYLVDVDSRMTAFAEEYQGIANIRFHQVRLEDLSNYQLVSKLFKDLRLSPSSGTKYLIENGQIINDKRGTANQEVSWTRDLGMLHEKIQYWYLRYYQSADISANQKKKLSMLAMTPHGKSMILTFNPELNLE